MADTGIRVLVVEDNPADRRLVAEMLAESSQVCFDATYVGRISDAVESLAGREFDVVILDLHLPDSLGFEGLVKIAATKPALAVVVLTSVEDEALGVEAVQRGASDYLAKGRVTGVLLARSLRYAIERKRGEEALLRLNESLERRVAERTEQLQAMALELTAAEQRERRRLAGVLHDDLQQLIAAAKMRVGLLLPSSRDSRLRDEGAKINEILQQAIDVSRTLSHELSPPILHEKGFPAALDWLSGWMRDKHHLAIEVFYDGTNPPESGAVNVFLYESVRELLFNVTKHAGVERARVSVTGESGRMRVRVEDDGRGFDTAKVTTSRGGFGLFSIRDRAKLFGGSLDVDSAPDRGSRFTLTVPLSKP